MLALAERQLEEELRQKVENGRVVYVEEHGYYALIPQEYRREGHPVHMALGAHYLGHTYDHALNILRLCWGTRPKA